MRKTSIKPWPLLAAVMLALGACAGSPNQESAGEFVDDSVITTRVKSAFVQDEQVSALNIKVETFKGVVQLSGFADDHAESRKAASIASGVKGVKSVRNDIAVK